MPGRILIIEDDPALVEVIRYNLEQAGFEAIIALDGDEGLLLIKEEAPDLAVVDWMLPKMSGVDLCRRVRATPGAKDLPMIMLTARGEESDKVRGLDAGADDYMVKPFSPRELVSRINAVLRRSRPEGAGENLEYGGIVMDLASHKVARDGAPIKLGPTEFRLLKVLMERPGRVFSREQLLDRAWGRDIHVELRTVDVHVRRLRKALNDGGATDIIRTVRSAGYAIDTDEG
ncbi:MAG: phosphate regulon transcriptional regulator PhoB [Rhodospirillales bacterium]|nr:phosphate regulon transcriptional regulator PhoB [Rhodospirillales bacterium]